MTNLIIQTRRPSTPCCKATRQPLLLTARESPGISDLIVKSPNKQKSAKVTFNVKLNVQQELCLFDLTRLPQTMNGITNDPSIALGHFQPIRLKATNPLCTFIWRKRKKNIQCNKILILAPIPQVTKLTPDVLSRRKFCQLHPTLQKREPRSVKIYLAHYFCKFFVHFFSLRPAACLAMPNLSGLHWCPYKCKTF